jgi:hypothetical protein
VIFRTNATRDRRSELWALTDRQAAALAMPPLASEPRQARRYSPPKKGRQPARPAAPATRQRPVPAGPLVVLVLAPGEGRVGERREAFGSTAFDLADLNDHRVKVPLRAFGHRSWDLREPRLEFRYDARAGLYALWHADEADLDTRNAISAIEKGHDAVSIEARIGTRLPIKNVDREPLDLVVLARLTGIALLRQSGNTPAYAGAHARVIRSKSQTERSKGIAAALDEGLRRARCSHGR